MKALRLIASLPLAYIAALGIAALLVLPSWMLMGPAGGPIARALGPWIEVYMKAMGTPAGPVVAIAAALAALAFVWRGAFKKQDAKKGKKKH